MVKKYEYEGWNKRQKVTTRRFDTKEEAEALLGNFYFEKIYRRVKIDGKIHKVRVK